MVGHDAVNTCRAAGAETDAAAAGAAPHLGHGLLNGYSHFRAAATHQTWRHLLR
jgi:hypothetical protein